MKPVNHAANAASTWACVEQAPAEPFVGQVMETAVAVISIVCEQVAVLPQLSATEYVRVMKPHVPPCKEPVEQLKEAESKPDSLSDIVPPAAINAAIFA